MDAVGTGGEREIEPVVDHEQRVVATAERDQSLGEGKGVPIRAMFDPQLDGGNAIGERGGDGGY
jgi:hypothetical protein